MPPRKVTARANRDMKDKKAADELKHKDGLLWRRGTQIACAVFMGLYRFTNTFVQREGNGLMLKRQQNTHWANAFPYRARWGLYKHPHKLLLPLAFVFLFFFFLHLQNDALSLSLPRSFVFMAQTFQMI
jgi:hypothetical protein